MAIPPGQTLHFTPLGVVRPQPAPTTTSGHAARADANPNSPALASCHATGRVRIEPTDLASTGSGAPPLENSSGAQPSNPEDTAMQLQSQRALVEAALTLAPHDVYPRRPVPATLVPVDHIPAEPGDVGVTTSSDPENDRW